jgi:outer membrane protein
MNKYLLLSFLAFAPLSLAHADYKIGVIDLGKTFESYYKTKDAQQRIQAKETEFSKDFQEMKTDYEHMGEEAQKLKDAASDPTLSADARADKTKAFQAKVQDLQNMERKMEATRDERTRELQDEIGRRHKEIVDEITKIISDYSGPQGFDLVVDKSSAASSGVSIILYSSPKLIDITQTIINQLNATAPPPGSATGAPAGAAPSPAAVVPH